MSALTLDEVLKLAEALGDCRSLPPHIKSKGDVVATILRGQELGFGPMTSLRLLSNIQGKEVVDAAAQLGLMETKAGWEYSWEETTNTAAVLRLKKGTRDVTVSFTAEDAKKAGLSGGNWQKRPDAMLRARCASKAAKMYAPEVLAGVYEPDEGREIEENAAPGVSAPVAELVAENDPEMEARIAEANGVRDEQRELIRAWDGDLDRMTTDDAFFGWVYANAKEIDSLDHRNKGPLFTVLKRHASRIGFELDDRRIGRGTDAGLNWRRLKETIADGCVDTRNDYEPEVEESDPFADNLEAAMDEDATQARLALVEGE